MLNQVKLPIKGAGHSLAVATYTSDQGRVNLEGVSISFGMRLSTVQVS